MSKYGAISGPYFLVFGLNTGKNGPEITEYLGTFQAVVSFIWLSFWATFYVNIPNYP